MNAQPSISLLEELSLNAYPGAGQVHYDGWALQVSPGHWRRANSVQVMHPSSRPLEEKIDLELVETQRIGKRVLMLRYKKV